MINISVKMRISIMKKIRTLRKKCIINFILEKNLSSVDMMTKPTTPRVFATTVTTNTEGTRNHGIAFMTNFTQEECVKTATSICTTKRKDNKMSSKTKNINYRIKLIKLKKKQ